MGQQEKSRAKTCSKWSCRNLLAMLAKFPNLQMMLLNFSALLTRSHAQKCSQNQLSPMPDLQVLWKCHMLNHNSQNSRRWTWSPPAVNKYVWQQQWKRAFGHLSQPVFVIGFKQLLSSCCIMCHCRILCTWLSGQQKSTCKWTWPYVIDVHISNYEKCALTCLFLWFNGPIDSYPEMPCPWTWEPQNMYHWVKLQQPHKSLCGVPN